MSKVKKKVLVGFLGDKKGGLSQYILNMCRYMDKEEVELYILTESQDKSLEELINSMGCNLIKIISKRKDRRQYKKRLGAIVAGYDVVYVHKSTLSNIDLFRYAKKSGIPKIIIHSHSSKIEGNLIVKILHNVNKFRINKYVNEKIACSRAAGIYMFGDNDDFKIIKNGINLSDFKFDKDISIKMKKELGLEDKVIIGHMGRFVHVKNHEYLIAIFKELNKINNSIHLLLCGDGPRIEEIKSLVRDNQLTNNVTFTGNTDNPSEMMQAMDIFVLPSLFEGAPFVVIEAVSTGLPVFMSDTITKEVKVNQLVNVFSLNEKKDDVAKRILDSYYKIGDRKSQEDVMLQCGFDIHETMNELKNILIS